MRLLKVWGTAERRVEMQLANTIYIIPHGQSFLRHGDGWSGIRYSIVFLATHGRAEASSPSLAEGLS